MGEIVLYGSKYSRSFTARWMLAELDLAYRVVDVDIRPGAAKDPAFLAVNPMGKVPAITDDGVVVTEAPAICMYLADRYGMGRLAPALEDPRRGSYVRWSVFATAVLEPAIYLEEFHHDPRGVGWGDQDRTLSALEAAVQPGPWLLGEMFTATDVAVGAVLSVAIFNKRFPERPALSAYDARLAARPAYQRAAEENWGSAA
jgi:glutathione S-transferase